MTSRTLTITLDPDLLSHPAGNLCLIREFHDSNAAGGSPNVVFLGIDQGNLQHENVLLWKEEYQISVCGFFAGGAQPFDASTAHRITPGQSCRWDAGSNLQEPEPRSLGCCSCQSAAGDGKEKGFTVTGLPRDYRVAVKMGTADGGGGFAFVAERGAEVGCGVEVVPGEEYILFWSTELREQEMFTSGGGGGERNNLRELYGRDAKAYAFEFAGAKRKTVRFGYATPNLPRVGEKPAWYDYGDFETGGYGRSVHVSSSNNTARPRPTVYASLSLASTQNGNHLVTHRFISETRRALLCNQETSSAALVRVRCDFPPNNNSRSIPAAKKIPLVASFLGIELSPSLSVRIEAVLDYLQFSASLPAKSPGFGIVHGESDVEKIMTLVVRHLMAIGDEYRPRKVEMRDLTREDVPVVVDLSARYVSEGPLTPLPTPALRRRVPVVVGMPPVGKRAKEWRAAMLVESSPLHTPVLVEEVFDEMARDVSPKTLLDLGAGQELDHGQLEKEIEPLPREAAAVAEEKEEEPEAEAAVETSFWITARCNWAASAISFAAASASFMDSVKSLKRFGYSIKDKAVTDTEDGHVQAKLTFGPGPSWQKLKREWKAAVAAGAALENTSVPPSAFVYLVQEKSEDGTATREIKEGSKEWKQISLLQTSPRSPGSGQFHSPPTPREREYKRRQSSSKDEAMLPRHVSSASTLVNTSIKHSSDWPRPPTPGPAPCSPSTQTHRSSSGKYSAPTTRPARSGTHERSRRSPHSLERDGTSPPSSSHSQFIRELPFKSSGKFEHAVSRSEPGTPKIGNYGKLRERERESVVIDGNITSHAAPETVLAKRAEDAVLNISSELEEMMVTAPVPRQRKVVGEQVQLAKTVVRRKPSAMELAEDGQGAASSVRSAAEASWHKAKAAESVPQQRRDGFDEGRHNNGSTYSRERESTHSTLIARSEYITVPSRRADENSEFRSGKDGEGYDSDIIPRYVDELDGDAVDDALARENEEAIRRMDEEIDRLAIEAARHSADEEETQLGLGVTGVTYGPETGPGPATASNVGA